MTAAGGKPAGTAPVQVTFPITLGQFLKVAGLTATGGEAKQLIASGLVHVNGVVETRRGRKLLPGDVVSGPGARAQAIEAVSAHRGLRPGC